MWGPNLSLVVPLQHAKAKANMLTCVILKSIKKALVLTEFLPEPANRWFLMSIGAEMKQALKM